MTAPVTLPDYMKIADEARWEREADEREWAEMSECPWCVAGEGARP